ncbi:hypothetical protein [Hyalangium rubrum]|uniref:Secreted protein n=1 Tax=Hyalangium rubrum TaxID=3103134 RepID=A0ABU5H8E5_9BACT|nr:hypothetical protein [Hyalangium sp. s54d21]MDY7229139.1 hypothetical protein [Hyalangium sp. s54d21]
MLRIWLCLFTLLFAPVGGFGFMPAVSSGGVCMQSCPDDDEQGQCALDCTDCTCCSHVRPVVLARTNTVIPSPPEPDSTEHDEQQPPSADAGDILHVPIAHLA